MKMTEVKRPFDFLFGDEREDLAGHTGREGNRIKCSIVSAVDACETNPI